MESDCKTGSRDWVFLRTTKRIRDREKQREIQRRNHAGLPETQVKLARRREKPGELTALITGMSPWCQSRETSLFRGLWSQPSMPVFPFLWHSHQKQKTWYTRSNNQHKIAGSSFFIWSQVGSTVSVFGTQNQCSLVENLACTWEEDLLKITLLRKVAYRCTFVMKWCDLKLEGTNALNHVSEAVSPCGQGRGESQIPSWKVSDRGNLFCRRIIT